MSIRTAIRATLVAASLFALAVTPAAAKPSLTITFEETSPCHFDAAYIWSGMGHGSDLTARILLVGVDDGGEALIASSSSSPVQGRFDEASNSFTSTASAPYQYKVVAYLQTSRGAIIERSRVESDVSPTTPEACA